MTVVLRVPETVLTTSGFLKQQQQRHHHKPGRHVGHQDAGSQGREGGTQTTPERLMADAPAMSDDLPCRVGWGRSRRRGAGVWAKHTTAPHSPEHGRAAGRVCLPGE